MDFQERLRSLWRGTKDFINKGIIQKVSRISYDIVWNILLFFIIFGVVVGFFVSGLGAGYFAALVKDEPLRAEEEMVSAIHNYAETSEVYFANDVYLGEVSSDLHREETTLDHVSEYIIEGIIATEDEYFETHTGIVPKATIRAVFQELTGSAMQTGGSTLTQQIIKNQILTNEVSYDRKAKEIILALRLEQFMDKDEILEAYLNIVPFGRNANGRNIAGIQTAAQGIFGINADEVNLAQAAFLAGLPQSPIAYSPFTNTGTLKDEDGLQPGLNRMQIVLARLVQADYITEEERQEALEFDLVDSFSTRTTSTYEEYPYLTEEIRRRTEEIFMEKLALADGYTLEEIQDSSELREQYTIAASREIAQGGYKIHTTINKGIYDAFQDVAANFNNYGRDKTARTEKGVVILTTDPDTGEEIPLVSPEQVGSVLIDNNTGAIIAFVGGRDFERDNQNYATRVERQVGSTAKPLMVYAPAMDLGIIQPGSIIGDVNLDYGHGGKGRPSNFTRGRYYGLVTVRTALANSYNVSAAAVFQDILKQGDPLLQYGEKMGLTTWEGFSVPSHSIGSFDATIEQNTSAYATFGNGGQHLDEYMIDRIETTDGEVIYEHERNEVEVFSAQTNYLMLDMMRDVLTRGTAGTARSNLRNPGVDWAGKTGTTNDARDNWFVATNPNVTLGTWIGYDYRMPLDDGYSARTQRLWAALVNAATEIDPELMAPSGRFAQPGNIVSRSFSLVSGRAPSELARKLGLVGSDIFNAAYAPSGDDNSLIDGSYVMVNGQAVLVGSNTPSEFTLDDGVMLNPEWLVEMGYDKLDDLSQLIPINNSAWDKVAVPQSTGNRVDDTGSAPNAPSSLAKSSNRLSWNEPSSRNVIGYRVYRASNPDANFSLVDSVIETSLNVGRGDAVYYVVAVDYFGRESEPSDLLIDGDFDDDEPDDDNSDSGDSDDSNRNNNSNDGDNNSSNNNDNSNSGESDDEDDDEEPDEDEGESSDD